MPHLSCLISHASSLMPHASCLISHASCPMPHAPHSSFADRLLHHLLIDRHDSSALGRIVFELANDATERLAQGARAEALLPRGIPGDGDERTARNLQIDAEAREVIARRAEDRPLRL